MREPASDAGASLTDFDNVNIIPWVTPCLFANGGRKLGKIMQYF